MATSSDAITVCASPEDIANIGASSYPIGSRDSNNNAIAIHNFNNSSSISTDANANAASGVGVGVVDAAADAHTMRTLSNPHSAGVPIDRPAAINIIMDQSVSHPPPFAAPSSSHSAAAPVVATASMPHDAPHAAGISISSCADHNTNNTINHNNNGNDSNNNNIINAKTTVVVPPHAMATTGHVSSPPPPQQQRGHPHYSNGSNQHYMNMNSNATAGTHHAIHSTAATHSAHHFVGAGGGGGSSIGSLPTAHPMASSSSTGGPAAMGGAAAGNTCTSSNNNALMMGSSSASASASLHHFLQQSTSASNLLPPKLPTSSAHGKPSMMASSSSSTHHRPSASSSSSSSSSVACRRAVVGLMLLIAVVVLLGLGSLSPSTFILPNSGGGGALVDVDFSKGNHEPRAQMQTIVGAASVGSPSSSLNAAPSSAPLSATSGPFEPSYAPDGRPLPPLINKCLVVISIHQCTRAKTLPEWSNFAHFLQHGYIPANTSTAMFDAVEYLFLMNIDGLDPRLAVALKKEKAAGGVGGTLTETVFYDIEGVPNAQIAITPPAIADIGMVQTVFPHIRKDPSITRFITMNSGTRGPLLPPEAVVGPSGAMRDEAGKLYYWVDVMGGSHLVEHMRRVGFGPKYVAYAEDSLGGRTNPSDPKSPLVNNFSRLVVGSAISKEAGRHMQSYFMAFSRGAAIAYYGVNMNLTDKMVAVYGVETVFPNKLRDQGFMLYSTGQGVSYEAADREITFHSNPVFVMLCPTCGMFPKFGGNIWTWGMYHPLSYLEETEAITVAMAKDRLSRGYSIMEEEAFALAIKQRDAVNAVEKGLRKYWCPSLSATFYQRQSEVIAEVRRRNAAEEERHLAQYEADLIAEMEDEGEPLTDGEGLLAGVVKIPEITAKP